MKHFQLGDDGFVSIGGEIRERVDSYSAANFGIGTRRDDYALQRLLVHSDLHVGERTRVFLQLGRHSAFDKSTTGPSDSDGVDVQNAFLDFVADPGKHLTLRIGRQDLVMNSAQRFVSIREGPNMRLSFDGVSGTWVDTNFHARGFYTEPIKYRPGTFDDASDGDQRFYGGDFVYQLDESNTLQVYALELDRKRVRFGGVQADERRHSFAFRWNGSDGHLDHDVEVMYQAGRFGDRYIRAWAASAGAGYTLQAQWSPRLALELDAGSGDRNAQDGRLGTFNPMFPKGPFFDPSSMTSWANLVLLRATASIAPVRSINLSFSVGERWRQSRSDAVYTQPYVPLVATLGNTERRVGEQYELNMAWQANRYLVLLFQGIHATAGPAIHLAGGRSVNFGMLSAQFRF
jgi:hypothetical protein